MKKSLFECPLCDGMGAEWRYYGWEPCICEEGYITAEKLEELNESEEMWTNYLNAVTKKPSRSLTE